MPTVGLGEALEYSEQRQPRELDFAKFYPD